MQLPGAVIVFLIVCGLAGFYYETSWLFSWLPLVLGVGLAVLAVIVGGSVSHDPPGGER